MPESFIGGVSTRTRLLAELHHALAAISLQKGHFLQAQREWRDAAKKLSWLKQHEGIRLQEVGKAESLWILGGATRYPK